MSEGFFSNLIPEILTQVFNLLPSNDLLSCCQVCWSWNEVASDNLIWYRRCHLKGLTYGLSMDNCPNFWKNHFMNQMRHCAKWRGSPPEPPIIISMYNPAVITDLVIHNDWTACSLNHGSIVVVDLSTQTKKHTFKLNDKGAIWCLVAFTVSGEDYLASGGNDGVVRVWKIGTGEMVSELENVELKASVADRSRIVRCLAVTDTRDNADVSVRLVSGGRYFIVLVWDVVTKTCVHVMQGHTGAIHCVKANREIVVSASYDKTVRVWSMDSGDILHVLSAHRNRVYTLYLASDVIVSSSLDQTMIVWNIDNGRCMHTLVGHTSLTKDMAMDTDESRIVSGNADTTVRVWSVYSGQCLFNVTTGANKHMAALTSVAVVKNTFIVSSDADGVVKLWRLCDGSFVRDILSLEMSGNTNVTVWKMVATDDYLICATGSSVSTLPSKLYIYNFSLDHVSTMTVNYR